MQEQGVCGAGTSWHTEGSGPVDTSDAVGDWDVQRKWWEQCWVARGTWHFCHSHPRVPQLHGYLPPALSHHYSLPSLLPPEGM